MEASACRTVTAADIAKSYRDELKSNITDRQIRPKLVAFLANEDPAAVKYAQWTEKTCKDTGIDFELRQCARTELEEKIVQANEDDLVHGIMVYYPVFGDPQDQYIQSVVNVGKDVEGLCHTYKFNMYHNTRFLDKQKKKKCIIPCTPLAIVKILEYLGVYNQLLAFGNRLHGKTICIINRSEIVGRPLAAMLANDGARVYSVDLNGVLEFHRGAGLSLMRHEVVETDKKLQDILPVADVIITGVPTPKYKVDSALLKEGVVAVNFSSFNNFTDDVVNKASLLVTSVGKVTVAMLERNLLRLYDYQQE